MYEDWYWSMTIRNYQQVHYYPLHGHITKHFKIFKIVPVNKKLFTGTVPVNSLFLNPNVKVLADFNRVPESLTDPIRTKRL